MTLYEVFELQQSAILYIYSMREEIDLDPVYQRMSDVWNEPKRQLLIDTLINGFDIPKIYFHEYSKPIEKNNKLIRYAVIDGKQRLQSIFEFIENKIPLAEDFTYYKDESIRINGKAYSDLAKIQPRIKIMFDSI